MCLCTKNKKKLNNLSARFPFSTLSVERETTGVRSLNVVVLSAPVGPIQQHLIPPPILPINNLFRLVVALLTFVI